MSIIRIPDSEVCQVGKGISGGDGGKALAAIQTAKAILDPGMRLGSYGIGFIVDIGMNFLLRGYNIHRLVREIAILEGDTRWPSTTKPASELTGDLLKGYWHKHHIQVAFMAHNLKNELLKDKTVERVLAPYIGQDMDKAVIDRLCHAAVTENYLRRSQEGRLTGEWIIFTKTDGRNHYVTLASHTEGDPAILERLQRYAALDQQMGWTYNKCSLHGASGVDCDVQGHSRPFSSSPAEDRDNDGDRLA